MQSWHDLAACRGGNTDDFYSDDPVKVERARAICETCPVAVECLAEAVERKERFGIWGGATTEERDRLLAIMEIEETETTVSSI